MNLIESIRGITFSPTHDFVERAFELPDGTPIPYTFPGWKKSVRQCADQKFWDFKSYVNRHKKGERLEKCFLKLWLRKEKWRQMWTICADFDRTLNSDHSNELDAKGSSIGSRTGDGSYYFIRRAGYQIWAQELQEEIGDAGYVFNSPKSGMPKIFFNIEYPEPVKRPSLEDAKLLLKTMLPKYFDAGCLDLSDNGIFTTYIPDKSRDEIMLALRLLKPIKITHQKETVLIGDPEDESKSVIEVKKTPTVYGSLDNLPEEFQHIRCGDKFKEFIRTLCVMTSLNGKGFGISQIVLSRTLDITQERASQYIRRAIKLGWLKVVDNNYIPDKRAKRYIAKGILRNVILKRTTSIGSSKMLPGAIPDGFWHHWIQEGVKVFWAAPIRFLEWFKTIPGWDLKDRWYQAKKYVEWHINLHPQFKSPQLISALT